jgi:hypothetical protein
LVQSHLVQSNALNPVNTRILDPDASKCSPDIGLDHHHRHPEIVIVVHLPDESGAPGVVFEGQLILTASFQNAKQSQIENLEHLRGMRLRCESNHAHVGSREKFDNGGSDVR